MEERRSSTKRISSRRTEDESRSSRSRSRSRGRFSRIDSETRMWRRAGEGADLVSISVCVNQRCFCNLSLVLIMRGLRT